MNNEKLRIHSDVPNELFEVKNIAVCITLGIVTFGIYGLIWIFSIIKKIKLLNNEEPYCAGELLLNMFIPFYSPYWLYTRAKKLSTAAANRNIQITVNGTLYLILALFGFGIISYAMIQNDLNEIAERLYTNSINDTTFENGTVLSNNYNSQNDTRLKPVIVKDPVERLKELSVLKEQGIITEEEFETKKKELLAKI